MQATYFKANKATSAKIIALADEWDEVKQRAKVLAKEHGADTETLYYQEFWGRTWVSGMVFKTPPDEKLWRRVKGTSDGWRPRRKRGSTLHREFDKLMSLYLDNICKLVGEPMFHNDGKLYTPGFVINRSEGTVYLSLSERAKAKGCRRISDLTYEKARLKVKNRRKK